MKNNQNSNVNGFKSNLAPHHLQELGSDEEERLEKLFRQLDVNGDGRIDIQDLTKAFETLGMSHHHGHAEKFIERSDVGKSGDIDFAEFVHYVVEHEKKLSLMFHCLDENKDGKLDKAEIISSFFKLGIEISRKEASRLINRIDKDGSLEIGFDEWRDYLLFHPSSELHDILHFWKHATYLDIGEDILVPDDFTEMEMASGMAWRHLMAGAIAGAVSRTFTAPLDRIKVFLQVRGASFSGISACFQHMYREGGAKSLWRGNGINVLKIAPETALKFTAYEELKQLIRANSGRDQLSMHERFIAGSGAGGISQTLIYPMEVLKTRLALGHTGQYKGIMGAARIIYQREGLRSFYRGYVPNLLGIIPYAGIDLAIYETLKNLHVQKYDKKEPEIPVVLLCATISSTCGQLASYPLALVRTRLQAEVQTSGTSQLNMTGVFRNIFRNEGITGLYRGITPNFMKVAPAVSISYVVYEQVRKLLGANMT